ncbi:IFI27_protein [Hexamita inflata]|uniref:IFI27_protein n=1 Tax=Hexamita inflata TaxID=28002 RepID=A0ABP1GXQ6_9EUKA
MVLAALAATMGFTKAGIVGGTLASQWMSAYAISHGGAVAAGSGVAIMQALGAGAGVAALAPLAGPAAIVGSIVAGGYGIYKYLK